MTSIYARLFTGATFLFFSMSALTQIDESSIENIERCRKLIDSTARLACYDVIGEPKAATQPSPNSTDYTETGLDAAPEAEFVREETAPPDPQADDDAFKDTKYGELTDDIGLPKSAEAYKPIFVTVVRCDKANNRKWYFHFDNGQVWQYIGARPLRYRTCNTPATLNEDALGFALQMEGDTSKLRVKRVR